MTTFSYPHTVYGGGNKGHTKYSSGGTDFVNGAPKGELIEALGVAIHANKIEPGRLDFAKSLYSQWSLRGSLSAKQWYWVAKLATPEAVAKPEKVEVTTAEGFAKIVALFSKASAKLKYPKILLNTAAGRALKLYVSGSNSCAPGTVVVLLANTKEYAGRINKDGSYKASFKVRDQDDIEQTLVSLGANPVAVAAAYGKQTGACCFCGRELTDHKSVKVGYGPICADHFGLPWGA